MSYSTLQSRLPLNVEGRFYVTDDCLDCALCREIAPANFKREDAQGVSFVCKQPETDEESRLVFEALCGCPCDAIHADGDAFRFVGTHITPKKHKACPHFAKASKPRPWWRFWSS